MTASQVITVVGDFQEAVRKHVSGCESLTPIGEVHLRLELMETAESLADDLAAAGCALGRDTVLELLMETADASLEAVRAA